jgi:hypothetical protein
MLIRDVRRAPADGILERPTCASHRQHFERSSSRTTRRSSASSSPRGAPYSRRLPRPTELIYDAYNAVTVAYSFTDRLKEAFCHVAAYRRHVNLGFNRGAVLADPERLLVGTGRSIRHLRLRAIEDLERPAVGHLVRAAADEGRSLAPPAPAEPRSMVKGAYAAKRRPG